MTFIVLHIIVYLILMYNTPIQPKYLKLHDPALDSIKMQNIKFKFSLQYWYLYQYI